MKDRQKQLLREIVENHIQAAEPIGSNLLVEKFGLSSATIRNEMAELEKQGLIHQPHTSAGRIPTESGYRFYIENYVDKDLQIENKIANTLTEVKKFCIENDEDVVKNLAKAMSEFAHNAVFTGFGKFEMYYTGLSNLFVQPEFQEIEMIRDISSVIDHLDEVVAELFDNTKSGEVVIGSENPFGEDCSSVMIKTEYEERPLLLGILGPIRMDYQKNYSLLNYVNNLITN